MGLVLAVLKSASCLPATDVLAICESSGSQPAVKAHRPAIKSKPTALDPSMLAPSLSPPCRDLSVAAKKRANILGKPAWTQDYATISKFPQYAKQEILLSTVPGITEMVIKMLKATDKQIVERMFEFEFGLPGRFAWPHGPCHVRGVLEQVLTDWKSKTSSQHELATITTDLEPTGYKICWSKFGVYGLLPEDCEKKLYVLHKPSGTEATIPERMQGKGPLTLAINWSAHDAELVTADQIGYKVTQFFPLPEQSEAQWIAFAERQGMARQGEISQQQATSLEQGAQG